MNSKRVKVQLRNGDSASVKVTYSKTTDRYYVEGGVSRCFYQNGAHGITSHEDAASCAVNCDGVR